MFQNMHKVLPINRYLIFTSIFCADLNIIFCNICAVTLYLSIFCLSDCMSFALLDLVDLIKLLEQTNLIQTSIFYDVLFYKYLSKSECEKILL